jgi:hypothetical protein
MTRVTGRQQLRGGVQVLVGKRNDFEASHAP